MLKLEKTLNIDMHVIWIVCWCILEKSKTVMEKLILKTNEVAILYCFLIKVQWYHMKMLLHYVRSTVICIYSISLGKVPIPQ